MGGRGSGSSSGGGGKGKGKVGGGGGSIPEVSLPELQGTEKQVAWANDIRSGFVDDTKAKLSDLQSGNSKYKDNYVKAYGEKFAEAEMKRDVTDLKAALNVVGNVTSASDWIDGRRSPMIMLSHRKDFSDAQDSIRNSETRKKNGSASKTPKKSILQILREQGRMR